MRDLLPAETPLWQFMESRMQEQLYGFGYREIRLPILEPTELFARSAGESSDLVSKEMYSFTDRNGDSLTLRPEGTAGCLRASIEHRLIADKLSRLWYSGPMFRHERPQKGRYRQFSQLGVEATGVAAPDIDAELLELCWCFWRALGVSDLVTLEINSLGTLPSRQAYSRALVDYLHRHRQDIDPLSRERIDINPMRVLDSKNPQTQEALAGAPVILDFLDRDSADHFDRLCRLLKDLEIPFEVNPRIVRGLDYYTRTAFEWTTDQLGAQNAVCAGGRYDDLSELLGGPPTPAVGFALGMDRLASMVSLSEPATTADIYLLALEQSLYSQLLQLARRLRKAFPHKRVVCSAGSVKIKSAMKQADRSGALLALLLGEEEVQSGGVSLKLLREDAVQELIPLENLEIRVKAELQKAS